MTWIVALYGVLIAAVSVLMILRPEAWVEYACRYIEKPSMHPVEIAVCLGFGAALTLASGATRAPGPIHVFGTVLIGVGGLLIVTPPSLHRRYGLWSVRLIGRGFRFAGVASFVFGILLAYAAVG